MNEIKAIIIDDEVGAREVLFALLFRHCKNVTVIGEAEDLESGVKLIKSLKPDVVFLDVQMPQYYGYEIGDFFSEINFNIIFVTAYDQYALRAFELSAIDYLLKPLNINRLKQSIQRIAEAQEIIFAKKHLENFNDFLKKRKSNKIAVQSNRNKYYLDINQIVALKAEASYTCIYTRDRKEHMISKNLKQTALLLSGWNEFFRCHKSWIINLKDIKIVSKEHFEITLIHDINVKLSRYKVTEFNKALEAIN